MTSEVTTMNRRNVSNWNDGVDLTVYPLLSRGGVGASHKNDRDETPRFL
jgi:hypothetical protein